MNSIIRQRGVGEIFQRVRTVYTSTVRAGGHHDVGGVPGANLPFGIANRHKLGLYIAMWFGSGFSVPFLLLRFQLKKKNQG